MTKLLCILSKSTLVLCFTLHIAYAMEGEEKKVSAHEEQKRTTSKKTSNNYNKEQYHLREGNFSKEKKINFSALYKHIHYTFKNENLLIDALHPLLPPTLQRSSQDFNRLEFLGDSVLGLIIRQRILQLFSNEGYSLPTKDISAKSCF